MLVEIHASILSDVSRCITLRTRLVPQKPSRLLGLAFSDLDKSHGLSLLPSPSPPPLLSLHSATFVFSRSSPSSLSFLSSLSSLSFHCSSGSGSHRKALLLSCPPCRIYKISINGWTSHR